MKYKQLGHTGLFVSELCLGTMTLGGNKDAGMWSSIGAVEQDDAIQLFARAIAGGVNFIDTADIYSFGQSERITGIALKALGWHATTSFLPQKPVGLWVPDPTRRVHHVGILWIRCRGAWKDFRSIILICTRFMRATQSRPLKKRYARLTISYGKDLFGMLACRTGPQVSSVNRLA